MPPDRSPHRKAVALGLAFGVSVLLVCSPALWRTGFLADDFVAGQLVTEHAAEHPGFFDRIATTFTRRWVTQVEFWHRPLLLLTIQLDYAVWGVDPRGHHVTSLVLWCLVALAATALFTRIAGPHRPLSPAVAGTLALLYPAGIESLSWLVSRDELLFTLFGLLALRARRVRPASVVAPLPWLACALLSKETAVVLVPLLNCVGALVPPAMPAPSTSWPRRILREAAPWIVLAAWFAYRNAILGSAGIAFTSKHTYVDMIEIGTIARTFPASLLQLIGGPNDVAVERFGFPLILCRAAFIAGAALVLASGLVIARRPGDWRRAAALLCGVAAPIALLSPISWPNPVLRAGRALVFPSACWTMLLAFAFDRALDKRTTRIAALAGIVILVIASASSLPVAFAYFAHKTEIAEASIRSLDPVTPGDSVMLLKTASATGGLRADLLEQGIALGIESALGPPFRPPPHVRLLVPLSEGEILSFPEDRPRPWVATLPPTTFGSPAFRIVAAGRSEGTPAELHPKHGAVVTDAATLRFEVRLPASGWNRVATASIVVSDQDGLAARADLTGPALATAISANGVLEVGVTRLVPPVAAEILRYASGVFLWWAEGRAADGTIVFRSRWQAMSLVPPR